MMKWSTCLALLAAVLIAGHARAQAPQFTPDGVRRQPFTATLSNDAPLAFGMNVEETSQALRQPLQYVGGAPGNETYLALRNLGGSGLINHRDRLFLQFRHGRLAGWKEDSGRNWMWQ
jgi:hypothetical protein